MDPSSLSSPTRAVSSSTVGLAREGIFGGVGACFATGGNAFVLGVCALGGTA